MSFEWDYTNVLTMLRLAGLPLRAADRDYRHPLVVIGGAVTFVNPEPLALFADVIAAGEGEVLVPALLDACRHLVARASCCGGWPQARGFYIPSFYDVEYGADGTIARFVPREGTGAPPVVRKAALKTTEAVDPPATSDLHARHRVRLALPDRGGARLRQPVPVLLGRLQLPAGPRVPDRADPRAGAGGPRRMPTRVGLVSIALCDHPDIEHILRSLQGHGLFDQPGVAAPRRPDADDRVAAARRAASAR